MKKGWGIRFWGFRYIKKLWVEKRNGRWEWNPWARKWTLTGSQQSSPRPQYLPSRAWTMRGEVRAGSMGTRGSYRPVAPNLLRTSVTTVTRGGRATPSRKKSRGILVNAMAFVCGCSQGNPVAFAWEAPSQTQTAQASAWQTQGHQGWEACLKERPPQPHFYPEAQLTVRLHSSLELIKPTP